MAVLTKEQWRECSNFNHGGGSGCWSNWGCSRACCPALLPASRAGAEDPTENFSILNGVTFLQRLFIKGGGGHVVLLTIPCLLLSHLEAPRHPIYNLLWGALSITFF